MSEGGNIIRIIGGKSEWIAEESMDLVATKDELVLSAAKQVNLIGDAEGVLHKGYDWKEGEEEKDFPTAYWSYDYEGYNGVKGDTNHSFRTTLEKTVYFQLNVNDRVPLGTVIIFQLFDYDTGLFMDWVNPDDKEFGGKEIKKSAEVREVNGKKRITIELLLPYDWKKEIAEDRGPARDGCLDFYWKWKYDGTNWSSDSKKLHLSVYPSDYRLRIKPAYRNIHVLPEIYSHAGDIISFALNELPDGKIEKFVVIKVRTTTTFKFLQDIDNFKREVYTESINLKKNTLESVSYSVEEVDHFFKMKNGSKQIYIDEEIIKTPVIKGTSIAYYNSAKQVLNFGKKAANAFDQLMILDEMRNMIPELSHNEKFNMPSLSTFVGFVPGAQVVAFGVAVIEWITMDMIKEMDEWVDEQMWIWWQNVKTKGLEAVKSEITPNFAQSNNWIKEKRFDYIEVSQSILNKIMKGEFKQLEEVRSANDLDFKERTHTIVTYRIEEPEIEDYYDIVDCIFINEEIEEEEGFNASDYLPSFK